MNFVVGDTVMCIDALPPDDCPEQLFCGQQYVVAYLDVATGCVGLVGVYDEFANGCVCTSCGSGDAYSHYDSWRFIKLDGIQQEDAARTTSTTKVTAR